MPAAQIDDAVPSPDEPAGPLTVVGERPGTGSRRMTVGSPDRWARLRLSLRPIGIFTGARFLTFLLGSAVALVTKQGTLATFTAWDSKWYLSAAQSGYATAVPTLRGNSAQTNLGFFPVLPLSIRAVHAVTRLSWSASGIVTSLLFGLLGSVALWWLLEGRYGSAAADRGTALVFLSPGAFVLNLVYTEGATILFVALTLLALERRRWILAGLAAAVASAVDPPVVAVVLPCLLAAWRAVRDEREWSSIAAPILAPAGVLAFFGYLWVHTGSPFTWFHAQRRGFQSGTYFTSVPESFVSLFRHGIHDLNWFTKAMTALVVVGLVTLFLRYRPPPIWIAYVGGVLFFGLLSPIIGMTPRLLLRAFPLIGVVGARLSGSRYAALLGVSALLMCVLGVVSLGSPLFTP